MNRRMLFMRRRIENDLMEVNKDPMEHPDRIKRKYLGGDLGINCAFLNFLETPLIGYLSGVSTIITIKITSDYPYQPPSVYSHDDTLKHPNKDPGTNQFMYSFIDPKYWKPTFELKQVLCGLEMVLITPELGYSTLKSLSQFDQITMKTFFSMANQKRGMDIEYSNKMVVEEEQDNNAKPRFLKLSERKNLSCKPSTWMEYDQSEIVKQLVRLRTCDD